MPTNGPVIYRRGSNIIRPLTDVTDGHAMITLPGVGHCMLGSGVGLDLPAAATDPYDLDISGSIVGSGKVFLNISAAEMARHNGKALRIKLNVFSPKGSPSPTIIVSTKGARCFAVSDQFEFNSNGSDDYYCTVGLFEGSATVDELSGKHRYDLKPGEVVVIRQTGISPPRQMTKAETSHDIGCKLAALGKPPPSRLPAHMLPPPPKTPALKINSLGMMFAPLPGTRVSMCIHETRYQDFAAYVAANPAVAATGRGMEGRCKEILWGWEHHPVVVGWDEAAAFCTWLGQKEGKKYRLPTDVEWSFAAGIGSKEKRPREATPEDMEKQSLDLFPWGRAWPPPPGVENIADMSWEKHGFKSVGPELRGLDDGYIETSPVMSFQPNALGFYDLGGNVSEWCDDWFNNARQGRVARGGSCDDFSKSRLSASSRQSSPTTTSYRYGFRVVMEAP